MCEQAFNNNNLQKQSPDKMSSLTKESELRQQLADADLPQTRPRARWNQGLHEVIRMKNKQTIEQVKQENSAVRRVTRIFRKLTQVSFCQICYESTKHNSKKFIADCEHKGIFCESCLHHYAVYTIEQFGKVRCPNSGCEQQLQIDSDFFKSLPSAVQTKYRRILRFYETLADPSLRLCPREACEGTLRANQDSMRCDVCSTEFCSRCLLSIHNGDCDAFELQFFEETLRYRQCPRCHSFIDKFQGCNHMTCICKHEFCYVCGANWDNVHYTPHDENGAVVMYSPNSVAYGVYAPRIPTRKQQIFFYSTLILRALLSLAVSGLILVLLPLLILLTMFATPILPFTQYSRYTSRIVKEVWSMYFSCYSTTFEFFFRKNRFS